MVDAAAPLTPAELDVLRQWDDHWRIVQHEADRAAVRSLVGAGYLERFNRRSPLYRLSAAGRRALSAAAAR